MRDDLRRRGCPGGALLLTVLLLAAAQGAPSAAPAPSLAAGAPVELWADGFHTLRGIVVAPDGAVLVADHHAGTVTRIDPVQGRSVIARGLDHPHGLALDALGRLVVVEEGAGRVVRREADGRFTPLIIGLKHPHWVAIADDGTMFVGARRGAREAEGDADEDDDVEPHVIVALGPDGRARVFVDGLRAVEGLAVGDDAALYALTHGMRTGRRVGGTVLRVPILPDGSAGPAAGVGPDDRYTDPRGLVRDELGALWITVGDMTAGRGKTRDVVVKLRPDMRVAAFASALADPRGVAFDADGNLFVADGARGRVLRFRAPAAPQVDAPPFTSRSTLSITGLAEAGAAIDAFVNASVPSVHALAGADGRFGIAVTLVPNAANAVAAYATARGGDGLTSAATQVTVVHDGLGPVVSVTSPAAGGWLRGTTSIEWQAADASSGVDSASVVIDGRPLASSVTPPAPAPAVSGRASWDTTGVTDGAHDVAVKVTDRAGNSVVVGRPVMVDNTPPETTIVDGPGAVVGADAAGFVVTGTDALSATAQLSFAWRLDGGAWSPFSPATEVQVGDLADGAHVFEARARDLAGNEDPVPAQHSFTVQRTRLDVAITRPAAGASVAAGMLAVTGTVTASGPVTVTVNDVPARVVGGAFAAVVPVTEDTTRVSATATMGAVTVTATTLVSVRATALGPVALVATPSMGVAPLTVTFTFAGLGAADAVAVDADGDGIVDVTADAASAVQFTYTQPGLYVATVTAAGRTGSALVQVFDRATLDAALQATWTAMKDALRAGRVEAALQSIAATDRDDYRLLFAALTVPLSAIDTILLDITLVDVGDGRVEYQMIRVDDGIRLSYFVLFVQDTDGAWRLKFL